MTPQDGNLLRVSGLCKHFFGIRAVNDLNFGVAAGSITGLIGPNGSGKTTSIDCLSGFQRPDTGKVVFDGADIFGLPPQRVAKCGLVRTFQNVRVYDALTVSENLVIAQQEHGRGMRWRDVLFRPQRIRRQDDAARERAQALLELVGLSHHIASPAGVLSYGQKKLLALAGGLMASPKLMVLDEPLAGVNPTVIRRIEGIVHEVNRQGVTFLIVEHNMTFIMNHCNAIVVMDAGSKLAEGSPDVIGSDARVLDAYLGKRPIAEASHG